jgi:ankyrin repeat protein
LKYGYTALKFASLNGHLDIAKMLVDDGADIYNQGNVSSQRRKRREVETPRDVLGGMRTKETEVRNQKGGWGV